MIGTDDQTAARLFGETTPTGSPADGAPAPAAAPAKATPPVFIPEAVAAHRAAVAGPAEKLFSGTAPDVGPVDDLILADHPMATSEELAAASAELGRILTGDLQLMREDCVEVLNVVRTLAKYPPDAKTRGAWRREAETRLTSKYGPAGKAQVVADMKAMVARDPRLGRLLDRHGAGDNPVIIMRLAEGAVRARTAGRFDKR